MRRILGSTLMVLALSATLVGATNAFFQDNEASTGNKLVSGAIDLKIDNTSYYNKVRSDNTTWTLADLTNQLFFNFDDIKPGDLGEDTISLHVDNNESWACMDMAITKNDESTLTEPEQAANDSGDDEGDLTDGELGTQIEFIFWGDDGDNVLETDETDHIIAQGTASQVLNGTLALADSDDNHVGGTPGQGLNPNDPNPVHIGKAWCFGNLEQTPAAPGENNPTETPGVTCDGSADIQTAQADELMGDITFRAVQKRNNLDFQCESQAAPPPGPP